MASNSLHLNKDELFCRKQGVLRINDLIHRVPSLIFLSRRHIDICCFLAQRQEMPDSLLKIYVNLLSAHSRKAKTLTALIELMLRGDIDVQAIRSDYIDANTLAQFADISKVHFISDNAYSFVWLDTISVKRLFVKYMMHRCYRFVFRKSKKADAAIRSWVEITEKMYAEKYPHSCILIYPFYLNVGRHIRYIRHCFRTYDKATLCGLPYSLWDLLKIAVKGQQSDRYYVLFERNAYQKHAEELSRLGIRKLYTSDEFEAGAVVMTSQLKQRGVRVHNTSHGLGFNSPFVGYESFQVYNSAQRDYYCYKSPHVNYVVSPRVNADHSDCVRNRNLGHPVIVFVEANFDGSGLLFEAELQEKAIAVAANTAKKCSVKMFIKAHPNRDNAQCRDIQIHTGIPVIRSLSELSEVIPLFITVNSAAYYDFKDQGTFLFVEDGFTCLENFYGEPVNSFSLEELGSALERYLSEMWHENVCIA